MVLMNAFLWAAILPIVPDEAAEAEAALVLTADVPKSRAAAMDAGRRRELWISGMFGNLFCSNDSWEAKTKKVK